MSEWIRHRGSKAMPKCLEGKRFEVRYRNGSIEDSGAWACWSHDGFHFDIMAYRILGDINPPDYSKGFPVGTTAKDIGAKVGDEFVVVNSQGGFKNGEVITLIEDDGDEVPYFRNYVGDEHCMNWQELAPIPPKTAIELQAKEVGIPEPVRLVDDAKPDADGWIEWKGGDCPVAHNAAVEYKMRNGKKDMRNRAESLRWAYANIDSDIIAYRLHQPQEWPEDRVDVIGQNGNDGLHYDAASKPTPELIADLKEHADKASAAFEIGIVPTNKYQRTIKGVTVDVYDVLSAFVVTCQARGHAIKKLLMAGQRGHKDEAQDLREAVQAIERSIELVGK